MLQLNKTYLYLIYAHLKEKYAASNIVNEMESYFDKLTINFLMIYLYGNAYTLLGTLGKKNTTRKALYGIVRKK